MKFFNTISGRVTEHKYRMKSEEEFFNDFGQHWNHCLRAGWCQEMNQLLGLDIDSFKNGVIETYLKDGHWFRFMFYSISSDMIVENKPITIKDILSPKKKIYENNIYNKLKRFKNFNITL